MENKEDVLPVLDWDSLKQRMRDIDLRLQEEHASTPESIRRQLQQRAARLAATPAMVKQEHELELLVFELSGEFYGIETRYVEAVLPLRQLTPIPCTPDFVLGVMNVRGHIRSVL